MPPNDPIGTIQQAITALLIQHEPAFLAIGARMFTSFATILFVWQGLRMMFTGRTGQQMSSTV